MDAEKLGAFIAENRKANGMTQADLAMKLRVTDKAVSRWERGIGFPDINTIEPLAHALGVSVLEIMKSEKMEHNHYSDVETVEMMKSAVEIEKENRKQVYTATGLAVFTTIMVAVLAWLAGLGQSGRFGLFGSDGVCGGGSGLLFFGEQGRRRKPENLCHNRVSGYGDRCCAFMFHYLVNTFAPGCLEQHGPINGSIYRGFI